MFRETLMKLNRCRVPYVVSGAFALQVHTGIWRATKDLDLFLTPEDVPAALRCLRKNGFRCEVRDPVWLHKAHRHGFFIDLITGMSNTVITVDRSWIKNARPAMVLDVRARVLAAEELLASKLFVVRRERFDGADIAHIVYASQGKLDWERILALVKEHWEILLFALVLYRYVYPAYSHYVPSWVWHRLLACFSQELTDRNPAAQFRGSLVDDKMFAIDVCRMGNGGHTGRPSCPGHRRHAPGSRLERDRTESESMRIGATADLHFFSPRFGGVQEQLAPVRDMADLLVIAGDLTNYGKPAEMEPLLNSLVRLRLPIVAVLGNHDYESGSQAELTRMMTEAGIKLLDGTAYERDGSRFCRHKGVSRRVRTGRVDRIRRD